MPTGDTMMYQGTDAHTGRGPSPNVWGQVSAFQDLNDEGIGVGHFIDFSKLRTYANVNAAEAFSCGTDIKVFGSDGASIVTLDELYGGATFASDGDNEGVSIANMGLPYEIKRANGWLIWEFRVKSSTITDTKHGWFAGLIDAATLSATVPIAAAGTLADENFIGFHRLEGDGDAVDFVYKANGVTQVTVIADLATLVADTWIKLAFWANHERDNKVRAFVNGVEHATTYTLPLDSAAGTDFPNDVRMGNVFSLLNATGTTPGSTSGSWIRSFQYAV